MTQSRDQTIETRAIEMARADRLEWVKRPRQAGQPDAPAGASNNERNDYREQARAEIDDSHEQAAPSASHREP